MKIKFLLQFVTILKLKIIILLFIESGACAFAFDAIIHDKSGKLECYWSSVINVNHRRYHEAFWHRHCVF